MEMYTKVSGKMIKKMVMKCTLTMMELSTMVNGKKINIMVKVTKHGLMDQVKMVATCKDRSMAMTT